MLRCTILVVLLTGLAFAATEDDNSTSTTPAPIPSTTTVIVNVGQNKTKENAGKGYGHESGRRVESRGRHEDHDYYHRDEVVHPFPDVKSYFDTHYCSVHGSFALSFNEKVEGEESYGQSSGGGGYGAPPSGYGSSQAYGSGGYSGGGGYQQAGGYGGGSPSYNEDGGYSKLKETKFVRKITRQYCRYTASWSDKACKFCCRVVARSAYTNPDDITAAIFSFDPANPAAGGAGIEAPKVHHGSSPAASYGAPPQQSYGQDEGYNQGGQYGGGNPGGYQQGGQQGYEQQNGGGNYGPPPPPPSYQQPPPPPPPPAYNGNGNPQYRNKRSNGYPAPPTEQYGALDAQSQDSYDVEEAKTVNQCVCCAPKHRYY